MPTVNLDVDLPGDGYLDIDKDFNVIDIFSNLPYRDGLVGSYFLSNQTISPLINYADINNPLKQFGSPAVGKSYAVLNRKNHFDTGLSSTETISIMAISLPLLETSGMGGIAASNYNKSGAIPHGDTLRTFSKGDGPQVTAYGDFGLASPPSANVKFAAGDINQLLISYALIRPGTTNVVGASYYNPSSDINVGGFNGGTVSNARQIETKNILIGATHSDTEFLNDSSVSVVLIFNKDIGSAGTIANERWLKGSFGAQWGLWP